LTFNVTLMTPGYIIQASDRRMVTLPDWKVFDDEANKGLVIKADDGVFSITFAGIGRFHDKRVDIWLAEKLLANGVPELPMSQGVQIIANLATDWLRDFPKGFNKRHVFIVAGWENWGNGSRAVVWKIANDMSEGGVSVEPAKDIFDVRRFDGRKSEALVQISGLTGAFSRDDKRRLEAVLKTKMTLDKTEKAVVDTIKRASLKTKWQRGINGNVLAVLLDKKGRVRATQYPISGKASRYIPLLLWYEAGRNYVVGDGWCAPNWNYKFGPLMLVNTPSHIGQSQDGNLDFLIRFEEAKHKKELVRDICVIKAWPHNNPKSVREIRTPKSR